MIQYLFYKFYNILDYHKNIKITAINVGLGIAEDYNNAHYFTSY